MRTGKILLIFILFLILGVPDVVSQRIYDNRGRYIGRVDGNRYFDGRGRSIGRVDKAMIYGTANPIKKSTKILMPDGQRKMERNIMVIKIMQRLIPRVNSSRSLQLQMLQYMTHSLYGYSGDTDPPFRAY